ncbi:MAG: histidine-histamine antiporter, partial [Plesiomonas sp.]
IIILLSVFASLLPYIYAIISLPILMINKDLTKTSVFKFYLVLVGIAFAYCLYALLGSGDNSLYWGILMVMITIPLYIYVAVRKHKAEEATTSLSSDTPIK